MDKLFKHFPPSVTWNWQFSSSPKSTLMSAFSCVMPSPLSAAGTGSYRRGMTLTQWHWTIIYKMSCSVFCCRLFQSQPFHYLFSSLILLCIVVTLKQIHGVQEKQFCRGHQEWTRDKSIVNYYIGIHWTINAILTGTLTVCNNVI